MDMRMLPVVLMALGTALLPLSTAVAGSSVTTTTTSTTTTTTLFGDCVAEPTYDSILCRLDALVAWVRDSSELGRFKPGLTTSVTKARKQCGKGNSTSSRTASNQLKKCAKTLGSFRHKLDSNNARRRIPEPVREFLGETVTAPLRRDVSALRATL